MYNYFSVFLFAYFLIFASPAFSSGLAPEETRLVSPEIALELIGSKKVDQEKHDPSDVRMLESAARVHALAFAFPSKKLKMHRRLDKWQLDLGFATGSTIEYVFALPVERTLARKIGQMLGLGRRHFDRAVDLYSKIYSESKSTAAAREMGWLFELAGQNQKAIEWYRKSLPSIREDGFGIGYFRFRGNLPLSVESWSFRVFEEISPKNFKLVINRPIVSFPFSSFIRNKYFLETYLSDESISGIEHRASLIESILSSSRPESVGEKMQEFGEFVKVACFKGTQLRPDKSIYCDALKDEFEDVARFTQELLEGNRADFNEVLSKKDLSHCGQIWGNEVTKEGVFSRKALCEMRFADALSDPRICIPQPKKSQTVGGGAIGCVKYLAFRKRDPRICKGFIDSVHADGLKFFDENNFLRSCLKFSRREPEYAYQKFVRPSILGGIEKFRPSKKVPVGVLDFYLWENPEGKYTPYGDVYLWPEATRSLIEDTVNIGHQTGHKKRFRLQSLDRRGRALIQKDFSVTLPKTAADYGSVPPDFKVEQLTDVIGEKYVILNLSKLLDPLKDKNEIERIRQYAFILLKRKAESSKYELL